MPHQNKDVMTKRDKIRRTWLSLVGVICCVANVNGQTSPCEITCDAVLPICSESSVTLSVPNDYQYIFEWSPGGQLSHSITVKPIETTTYSVTIRDRETLDVICQSDPFTVTVKPRFTIDFRQLQLTCSNANEDNGKTAMMLASASGGEEPYEYKWQVSPLHIAPNDPAIAIGLMAYTDYTIKVTDGRGCTQTDTTRPKAYPNPIVEISTDPSDTVYIQNPHVIFTFDNLSSDSIELSNFFWIFNTENNHTSTLPEPQYTYSAVGDYTAQLKVFNPQGCDTTYSRNITVCPVKLKVPNVFTPNGDGINDFFIISLDDSSGDEPEPKTRGEEWESYKPLNTYYEKTELVVFNRWGRIVYKSNNYQNNWDGGNLPDGTYFYVIKCTGYQEDATYKGSVSIIGSGN